MDEMGDHDNMLDDDSMDCTVEPCEFCGKPFEECECDF